MQTDQFQGLLLKGERIVWRGHPAQGLLFTSRDLLLVPFSLMFLGFFVHWEYLGEFRSSLEGYTLLSVVLWWMPGPAAASPMP